MSLGFLNYNPQTGVQYPAYPYDSGMAYPPYGLRWPLPQVRGNAMLPYAISEGLCARNGQWPWFLRTPRVVTGKGGTTGAGCGLPAINTYLQPDCPGPGCVTGARKPGLLGPTLSASALTTLMVLLFYWMFAESTRAPMRWRHAWLTAGATGIGVGAMAYMGMRGERAGYQAARAQSKQSSQAQQ